MARIRLILSRKRYELDGLPAEGLEPTRSCDHWILSPARLPIPPRRLMLEYVVVTNKMMIDRIFCVDG
jgi:hypothetical protein